MLSPNTENLGFSLRMQPTATLKPPLASGTVVNGIKPIAPSAALNMLLRSEKRNTKKGSKVEKNLIRQREERKSVKQSRMTRE